MSSERTKITDLSVLDEAFRLIHETQSACGKLGLWGKSNAALPHEMRMFAADFSIEGDTRSKDVMRRLKELHVKLVEGTACPCGAPPGAICKKPDCLMLKTRPEYTEGVCGDGAAILCDGRPMTISEILAALNGRAGGMIPVSEALRTDDEAAP